MGWLALEARLSGGLGAPRGTTCAPVPPLLGRAHGWKDQLGLIRAFQAKIRHWSDISAPICRVTPMFFSPYYLLV